MVSAQELRTDVNALIDEHGVTCRFRYFTPSYDSTDYDGYDSLAISGTDVWTSGLKQPLDKKWGSNDGILLQEGKLLQNDNRLYIKGNISTSGTLKIQIGSPSGEQYAIVNSPGDISWDINNIPVYKKLYLRVLTNGSIAGE